MTNISPRSFFVMQPLSLSVQCESAAPVPECSIYYPELDTNPGPIINPRRKSLKAFTLIELSIVLVVIGLIVGGVLVGRDLIKAAEVRAQISQIEKYQSAVNTFRGKFGELPGDIGNPAATQFGFVARSGAPGRGDMNGELDGFSAGSGLPYAWNQDGENLFFWEDLSSAGLIDGSFNSYVDGTANACTATSCNLYLPQAKLGNGNRVYVYSGYALNCCVTNVGIGPNFFGLNAVTIGSNSNLGSNGSLNGTTQAKLTVQQSYAIDKKIDDGYPQSGNVMAQYIEPLNGVPGWAPNAGSDSASTCFNTGANPANYSVTYNNGASTACALSFQIK